MHEDETSPVTLNDIDYRLGELEHCMAETNRLLEGIADILESHLSHLNRQIHGLQSSGVFSVWVSILLMVIAAGVWLR
jgi:transcription elongation factor GreA-like protein